MRPRTLLAICVFASGVALPVSSDAETTVERYTEAKTTLADKRQDLAARWKAARKKSERTAVLNDARATLLTGITAELIPPWVGTPWAFYGTSQTPGKGDIACGYFVTTVLRDAGLAIERVRLAQQASEYIVRTLAPARRIWRFSNKGIPAVLARVKAEGEGLYVIGLDYHVGLLWNDGESIRFCHSTYLGDSEVLCEPAASSPAMVSGYHVVGELLNDRTVRAWLTGRDIPTVQS